MANKHSKLEYLTDLSKYEMADHDPDVRGWDVYDAHGEKVGKITALLVNPERKKVVYLDVEPLEELLPENHNPFESEHKDGVHEYQDKKGNVRIIIPVGVAHVDRDKKVVIADGIQKDSLKDYPAYRFREGLPIHVDYERQVRKRNEQVFSQSEGGSTKDYEPEANYYDSEHYDSNRFFDRNRNEKTP